MHRRSAGWPNQLQPSCASDAHPRRVLRHVVLAQHTGRAARKGGGNEAVAVRGIARNGGKQLAGRGRAGIIAHARQLQLRVGVLFEHLDALQKLV